MRPPANAVRAVAVAVFLAATPALAIDWSGGQSSSCAGCLVATGVIVGVIDLAFVAVGIPMLATGHAFLPGWSIVEIIWGAGHLLVGLIVTPLEAVGVARGVPEAGGGLAVGIILLVVGGWLMAHGIANIPLYFRRRAEDRSMDRAGRRGLVPRLSASLTPGGGSVATLSWAF